MKISMIAACLLTLGSACIVHANNAPATNSAKVTEDKSPTMSISIKEMSVLDAIRLVQKSFGAKVEFEKSLQNESGEVNADHPKLSMPISAELTDVTCNEALLQVVRKANLNWRKSAYTGVYKIIDEELDNRKASSIKISADKTRLSATIVDLDMKEAIMMLIAFPGARVGISSEMEKLLESTQISIELNNVTFEDALTQVLAKANLKWKKEQNKFVGEMYVVYK